MDGSGSQIGLIFFSHLDALNMLKDMQKNPGASDARVYIMGLDKAYEMVKAKPTPSGIRGSGGEEMTMVFRFYPDSKQVKAAEGLQRKMRLSSSVQGVPVFVAKGLTLRKGNENIVPLFLTKEDLDASWAKLRESNKHLPNSAPVAVGNLLYIIQQMESDEQPQLRNLGFFAPRASVEYVSKEQAGPTGQARLHQNPVNPQNNK
ncbi:Protein TIC 22, chloroplastic [Gracilariopsis chorda]|uniref:Protein TIC 22, chloroplastic n=1 Tax=Gracilariopsis chorda TaxID=448386 RepID=A0A2V3IZ91_9FLOR|nr:Protein TIC 22, chloroplastic [Gracilariopsis chorda]|eukprot:PXF47373.1 Protein TIC 22, chloroplastic [Gracilariopsis chorda]